MVALTYRVFPAQCSKTAVLTLHQLTTASNSASTGTLVASDNSLTHWRSKCDMSNATLSVTSPSAVLFTAAADVALACTRHCLPFA